MPGWREQVGRVRYPGGSTRAPRSIKGMTKQDAWVSAPGTEEASPCLQPATAPPPPLSPPPSHSAHREIGQVWHHPVGKLGLDPVACSGLAANADGAWASAQRMFEGRCGRCVGAWAAQVRRMADRADSAHPWRWTCRTSCRPCPCRTPCCRAWTRSCPWACGCRS